jgi:short-subunit dehydrogenase
MAAKLAVITGASGGLGLEFAKLVAQAGYDLALVARSAEKLASICEQLKAQFGISAAPVVLDLATPDASRELFARIPSCDVLINNAGFANSGKFAQIDARDVTEEIQLNVLTLTQLTRLYLPGMLERKDGKVLNVASTAGFVPGPNMAVYYATKAYVISFSQALASEVSGSGVTVTVLCPGATATGFQQRARQQSMMLVRLGLADAGKVAKAGFDGMMHGKTMVIPGITNVFVANAPRFTPRRLLTWISAKLIESGR